MVGRLIDSNNSDHETTTAPQAAEDVVSHHMGVAGVSSELLLLVLVVP